MLTTLAHAALIIVALQLLALCFSIGSRSATEMSAALLAATAWPVLLPALLAAQALSRHGWFAQRSRIPDPKDDEFSTLTVRRIHPWVRFGNYVRHDDPQHPGSRWVAVGTAGRSLFVGRRKRPVAA